MKDSYNIALIIERGFEESCIREFERIIGKKLDFDLIKFKKMSIVILKKIKFEEAINLSYVSRVIHDSLILLAFENIEKLEQVLNNLEIPFEFSKIRIKLIKDSKKYGDKLSKFIYKKIINKIPRKGEIELFLKGYIVNNKFIIGISFSDSIGKRKYKIVEYKESINPVSISTFLNYLEIPEESILNIYSKDGTIPIEIGIIFKNIPANFWSKKSFYLLNNLDYLAKLDEKFIKESKNKIYSVDNFSKNILVSKRNAINAMVKDIIFFKRADPEYLDLIINKKFKLILIDLYKQMELNIKNIMYSSSNLIEDEGKIVIISDKNLLDQVENISKKLNLEILDIEESIFLNDVKRFYILKKK
ncbi:MAG: hypothetical protein QXD25_00940 [Nanopusillaceae archaeon]